MCSEENDAEEGGMCRWQTGEKSSGHVVAANRWTLFTQPLTPVPAQFPPPRALDARAEQGWGAKWGL